MITKEKKKALAYKLKKEFCQKKGKEKFLFKGKSMYPILQEGDRVIVKYLKPSELKFGNIIVYQTEDKYVIHRYLYSSKKSAIIAKGDNCFFRDLPFSNQNLLGKLITIHRNEKVIYLNTFSTKLAAKIIALFSIFEAVTCELIRSVIFSHTKINPKFKQKGKSVFSKLKSIMLKILFKLT
ncbi:signal peptidase I [Candidatus Margulisiibacteriota bacterium]